MKKPTKPVRRWFGAKSLGIYTGPWKDRELLWRWMQRKYPRSCKSHRIIAFWLSTEKPALPTRRDRKGKR